MVGRTVRNGLASIVATVWVVNFVGGTMLKTFAPDPAIHAAFMLVLGAIYGSEALRARGDTSTKPKPREDDAS